MIEGGYVGCYVKCYRGEHAGWSCLDAIKDAFVGPSGPGVRLRIDRVVGKARRH